MLNALKSTPANTTPNVCRWYKHIQSYNAEEKKKFASKNLTGELAKIISGDAPAAAPADDDDDVDLFGSDEDVSSKIGDYREADCSTKTRKTLRLFP